MELEWPGRRRTIIGRPSWREVRALAGQVAEIYQDVRVGNELIVPGVRECAARAAAVLPALADAKTILDIGSGFGYFARAAAYRYPDSLVISVERDPASVRLQHRLLELEKLTNVILIEGDVSLTWLQQAGRHGIRFDAVLLLAVIHHFPENEVRDVVESFGNLSPTLIVELPHENEVAACGAATRTAVAGEAGRIGHFLPQHPLHRTLGFSPSHVDSGPREIVAYHSHNSRRTARPPREQLQRGLRGLGRIVWPHGN